MRIISGKFKGRRIKISKGLPIRPTTDIAKESLFNIKPSSCFEGDLLYSVFSSQFEFLI